ncbi:MULTISPECIES: hypothetical protein [Sphingobium]|jgi:hypothetical protein|uniref:Uncharacterized protein n=1 Tax=Sphingobium fuliginis (strain ATCC 27551) TaxID=336203 RepID=A0A292YVT3_SPHSA|nr:MULTISPECIES: hypothetical protein [Sphingobium]QOT71521.1 hypothetical protein H5V43_15840 [Sphingobium fuliginis]GAY19682.1 hypothetical protein SFOMI_0202 [Sphingobium fuliginis]
MILLLIAASLAAQPDAAPRRIARVRPAPCQAVPALCLTETVAQEPRLGRSAASAGDGKMSAYRFDARPCRIVGNMGCPKRANRQIFRLGEPIGQTLARSFGLD